jgi:hypothetical protein
MEISTYVKASAKLWPEVFKTARGRATPCTKVDCHDVVTKELGACTHGHVVLESIHQGPGNSFRSMEAESTSSFSFPPSLIV